MKRLALAMLLVVLAGAAAWWGWRSHQARKTTADRSRIAERDKTRVQFACWFPSREGMELCEETTWRPVGDDPTVRLRGIIEALHRGPTAPCSLPLFPPDTAPRAVFLTADGTACLDYPRAVFDKPMGLREEVLFLRAIGRTLLRNTPDVRTLVILVEGAPSARISLHMPADGRYNLPR